ncbi:MAG: hypothetical protein NVS4B5_11620 [Vulcanimicrobiaceae bacterium]
MDMPPGIVIPPGIGEAAGIARERDLHRDALPDGDVAAPAVRAVGRVPGAGRPRNAKRHVVHDERFRWARDDDTLQRERADDAWGICRTCGGNETLAHLERRFQHGFGEGRCDVSGFFHAHRDTRGRRQLRRWQAAQAVEIGLTPRVGAEQFQLVEHR